MKLMKFAVLGLILSAAVSSTSSTSFACGESTELKAGVAKNVDKEQAPDKKQAEGDAKNVGGSVKRNNNSVQEIR